MVLYKHVKSHSIIRNMDRIYHFKNGCSVFFFFFFSLNLVAHVKLLKFAHYYVIK